MAAGNMTASTQMVARLRTSFLMVAFARKTDGVGTGEYRGMME